MLPILCYHKVGPVVQEGRRLNIEPAVLESHVRYFVRKHRRFARAGDLESGIPAGCVCMTFDDAYVSAMTHAVEVLRRHGVWGTFFAVPGMVGGESTWDGGDARPLAGWDALKAAQSEGMEIANHTMNHLDLTTLAMAQQAAEIEAAEDLLIEHGLGGRSVCFPYGKFNASTMAAMDREGCNVGLAIGSRPARTGDELRCLPRIVVAYSDKLPKLLYKIHLRPKLPTFKRREHYV